MSDQLILMPEINWNNFNSKVSKYFTVGEVTQNDRRRIPSTNAVKRGVILLAQELDEIREKWGKPIGVTSWYRPAEINRAVGGVSNSSHILGIAADIYPTNGNVLHFQHWLDGEWQGALGYGAKRGFVHVDLRGMGYGFNDKFKRLRWNY